MKAEEAPAEEAPAETKTEEAPVEAKAEEVSAELWWWQRSSNQGINPRSFSSSTVIEMKHLSL